MLIFHVCVVVFVTLWMFSLCSDFVSLRGPITFFHSIFASLCGPFCLIVFFLVTLSPKTVLPLFTPEMQSLIAEEGLV